MSRNSQSVKEWRARTKNRIVESFGGKCCICGYSKCINALELHHLNPIEKEFSFGSIRANPKNWGLLVKELRKCCLVCCLCHREIHSGLIAIPSDIAKFDEDFSDYKKIKDIDKKESISNKCRVCGNDKLIWAKTCSVECSSKINSKIDWGKYDLYDLYVNKLKTYSAIAKIIGCTTGAVGKVIKKMGIKRF